MILFDNMCKLNKETSVNLKRWCFQGPCSSTEKTKSFSDMPRSQRLCNIMQEIDLIHSFFFISVHINHFSVYSGCFICGYHLPTGILPVFGLFANTAAKTCFAESPPPAGFGGVVE